METRKYSCETKLFSFRVSFTLIFKRIVTMYFCCSFVRLSYDVRMRCCYWKMLRKGLIVSLTTRSTPMTLQVVGTHEL